ncbi:hypothetical protein B0A71_00645 [Flavobacterium tructae]|uniref:Uncharacterized protein n=1 Tax=Flavobacterium tructae TaxID=1114873 RepID=A0A1S1J8Z6_9FLAO|nr:hypothetical protein BHE19_00620 [Flavobacterium tructae]OXB22009.1 hypothetical protein B0A71_00645 [Flavobacterium tructae]
MTTKYKLTSDLGIIFTHVCNIIGVIILFFLIYSILIVEIGAIIFCLILESFLYLKFYRFFSKFKNVTFDINFFYFENEVIPIKNITNLKKGRITYTYKNETKELHYNYFYGINYNKLKEFHNNLINSI